MLNIDNILSHNSFDNPNRKVLDIKTTTVDGLLKILTEEVIFKNNLLEGIIEFKGIVYRVNEDLSFENSDWSIISFFKSLFGSTKVTSCKVRIPELHGYLDVPNDYDVTYNDNLLIDLYDDIIVEPSSDSQLMPVAGDIVVVRYSNVSNYKDGKIVKIITFSGKKPTKEEVEAIREKFKNSKEERPGDKKVVQYINGDPAGQMVVRPVLASGKLMYGEAADRMNALGEEAKLQNVPLDIVSGYRNQEEQTVLYQQYLDYKAGKRSTPGHYAVEKPGGHGKGYAADLSTGGWDTPVYEFLQNNAPKYEIVNSGKYFSEAEHWHWEFFPAGSPERTSNSAVQKAIKESGLEDL